MLILAQSMGLSCHMVWFVSIIIPLWLDGRDESQRSVSTFRCVGSPILTNTVSEYMVDALQCFV